MVAQGYKHFCASLSAYDDPRAYLPEVLAHLGGFRERVLQNTHATAPWASPIGAAILIRFDAGRFECWASARADMPSAFQPFEEHFLLNVVEGDHRAQRHGVQPGARMCPSAWWVADINPVHVDAIASLLMGHDPHVIPYLVVARERGLGESDPTRIPDLPPPGEDATHGRGTSGDGRALPVFPSTAMPAAHPLQQ